MPRKVSRDRSLAFAVDGAGVVDSRDEASNTWKQKMGLVKLGLASSDKARLGKVRVGMVTRLGS